MFADAYLACRMPAKVGLSTLTDIGLRTAIQYIRTAHKNAIGRIQNVSIATHCNAGGTPD